MIGWMAALTSQQYVESRGLLCPNCGGGELDGRSFDTHDGGCVTQPVGCLECYAQWVDVYRLDGYENLVPFTEAVEDVQPTKDVFMRVFGYVVDNGYSELARSLDDPRIYSATSDNIRADYEAAIHEAAAVATGFDLPEKSRHMQVIHSWIDEKYPKFLTAIGVNYDH